MLSILLGFQATVQAAHARPQPVILLTTAITYPVSFDPLEPLPPSIAHGLGVLMPTGQGWGCYNELALSMSFTALAPAAQLITGPTKRVNKNLVLSLSGLYKVVPPYGEVTGVTHIVGGAFVPLRPLRSGDDDPWGSLSFPLGVAYNLASDDLSVAFNVKLGLRLH